MVALHANARGAIAPTLLPFSVRESRDDADLPELTKLLGKVYDLHDGVVGMIARANVAIPKQALSASYALFGVNNALRTVALTTGGETICGYTFPDQKDVAAGELFWILIPTPGEGRISVVADGAAISGGGVYLQGGAAGTVTEVIQSTVPGVTPMKALAAVAAGEVGDVMASGNTVF